MKAFIELDASHGSFKGREAKQGRSLTGGASLLCHKGTAQEQASYQ
ncbi:hypothetical protein LDZ77_22475 [Bacteroides xylanisolvens]|uniref:Uncharacterized protein n=1 Tax=Bacteroides xylanisolvens TaxID=371601 RepID=A0AAW4T3B3_9BACE|nr:hypothetical protein [Bacteroides xylanisolvens]MCA4535004.1 hypothetical protein [Bacteroides xylanisolvens]MCA4553057.1 hypothetical protein [Bacteroides xylanisolvens]MCA4566616.1 hypothetical protein [Bacteroides xylanisolvens]MCA4571547.1 hypothetical protein [Bacteroides xylanisolvens]MCA4602054.1 hypothetical protein [Bacteroides xylanisolvens]